MRKITKNEKKNYKDVSYYKSVWVNREKKLKK